MASYALRWPLAVPHELDKTFGGKTMNIRNRLSLYVVSAMLGLPAAAFPGEAGPASNQAAGGQETRAQSPSTPGTSSASKEKAPKKSNENAVQSRGLFQKKKKKQKGGSAGHSQASEQTDIGGTK
jgi:hypothetical protein